MQVEQNPNVEAAADGEEEIDFRFKRGRDTPSDVRNALLTVAVLLAAATYQAVFTPPGGLWQDDGNQKENGAGLLPSATQTTTTEIKQVAGISILGTKDRISFIAFLIGNTVGFLSAMNTIEDLTKNFPLKVELDIAIGAICVSYGMCVSFITPNEYRLQSTLSVMILSGALVAGFRMWREKGSC